LFSVVSDFNRWLINVGLKPSACDGSWNPEPTEIWYGRFTKNCHPGILLISLNKLDSISTWKLGYSLISLNLCSQHWKMIFANQAEECREKH